MICSHKRLSAKNGQKPVDMFLKGIGRTEKAWICSWSRSDEQTEGSWYVSANGHVLCDSKIVSSCHIVQIVLIEPLDANWRNRHKRSKSYTHNEVLAVMQWASSLFSLKISRQNTAACVFYSNKGHALVQLDRKKAGISTYFAGSTISRGGRQFKNGL